MNQPDSHEFAPASASEPSSSGPTVAARPIEFPAATGSGQGTGQLSLNRFYDVSVSVSVELGRVEMPIGDLLRLGEDSIIELEREVDEPVDIMAQGVLLARGDIVVVNGRYAVRITEIVESDSERHDPSPQGPRREASPAAVAQAAKF